MEYLNFSLLLLIPIFFTASALNDEDNVCVYALYVRTGSVFKGGTDSTISATIGDSYGRSVWIPDLKLWGLMGPKHNYFERGNLDIFSGRGPCIGAPICRLNLTSDGSGSHHGWYCNYVEVTSTGPHTECSQTIFQVEQWLATDVPPYRLAAVLDGCGSWSSVPAKHVKRRRPFVVRHPIEGSAAS
ncbi:hypothetical protein K2173_027526 [Erythroxylum novogranatense]|uniref:PLAT domain-containing protein n=1 Tax=Erythroxylum novogranatense TaxID=1862640 RepID=A0AAV8U2J2_9ROSI|nr:hypothetical protein K2173_027526 [Erythroxylum novogranatense]